ALEADLKQVLSTLARFLDLKGDVHEIKDLDFTLDALVELRCLTSSSPLPQFLRWLNALKFYFTANLHIVFTS
ncbi:hypothetical protein ACC687_39135, partial [Rhizobium ruizarguesonis]